MESKAPSASMLKGIHRVKMRLRPAISTSETDQKKCLDKWMGEDAY